MNPEQNPTPSYPRFADDAVLVVGMHNGEETWTGAEWNEYVESAERNGNMVTARLIGCPVPLAASGDVAPTGGPVNPEQTPALPTPEEKRRDQIAASMRRLAAKHPNRGVEYMHVVTILQTVADGASDAEFRAEARAALAALELVQREAGA